MPEITVAITAYNLEAYIDTCIQELLRQSFSSFEIIVYDDCSADRTRAVLTEYRERYPEKIRLLLGSTPLRSPARARNAVLDSGLIRGKYIVFLDGDDSIEDTFLERLYTAAEAQKADMALCAYDRVEEGSGHVLAREMLGLPSGIAFPPGNDILAFINGSLWNKLILVERIGSLRLPDFKVGEDISFQFALFERCRRIACVDQILIHYRVRTSSVISSVQRETICQFAEELLRLRSDTGTAWMRDTLELVAFIHIGISMPLREYSAANGDIASLLRWVSAYFREEFGWFRGNPWLKLPALMRHGVRGLGLWTAKLCYRAHCFRLFLWLYRSLTSLLHMELKF